MTFVVFFLLVLSSCFAFVACLGVLSEMNERGLPDKEGWIALGFVSGLSVLCMLGAWLL